MAKDVPRALIRTGSVADYAGESRGIFVFSAISVTALPTHQDHQNDRALGEH